MRPYPGQQLTRKKRCYNYCLSLARRRVYSFIWHPFNTLACLQQCPGCMPQQSSVVKATCILQNYMRRNNELEDRTIPQTFHSCNSTPSDSGGLQPITLVGFNSSSREAASVRDKFCGYFSSLAEVSWQNSIIKLRAQRHTVF